MGKIQDLDVLFPEDEIVKFKVAGKEYSVKMFIPAAVGFTIIDNLDKVMNIFPGGTSARPKISREAVELVIQIITDVCHEQYEEIDREWVRKNISLPKLGFIVYKMALPVYEFLTNSGFLEAVMPLKTPE